MNGREYDGARTPQRSTALSRFRHTGAAPLLMRALAACCVVLSVPDLVGRNAMAADAQRPVFDMREAYEVDAYGDAAAAISAKGAARGSALATADFDRNGTPDVVAAYAAGNGGIVTLLRGNPDAFAPADETIFARLQQGYDPASLLAATETYATPVPPDFLVAGAFGSGAETGVVVAAKDGGLYVLRGDGRGGLAAARQIPLPGRVTAIAAGEFRAADGYTDLAVGVSTPVGDRLLVFDDAANGFAHAALDLPLPGPAIALEFGGLDSDPYQDVAVATDAAVLVVHGWGRAESAKASTRVERIATAPGVIGLAIGEFAWDRAGRSEIALLTADGIVDVVRGADLDQRPYSEAEAAARTRGRWLPKRDAAVDVASAPSWQPARAGGWVRARAFKAGTSPLASAGVARPLLRTNVSYREADDLLVIGGAEAPLEFVHEVARTSKAGSPERTMLELEGEPIAVLALPKKLNGVRDFVVLDSKRTAVTLVPQAPNTTITVDRTDDNAAASACTVAGNDCSLRGAFTFANNPTNNNTTISVPAGTYALNINGGSADGCDGNATGDLAANQTMSLIGAGAATTIIRQTGTGPANDGDRVMCMCEQFTENLIFQFSAVTFSGGRDGTAAGTGTAIGGGGIIGGERGNALTLTNVVFTNNQVTVSANIGGGGLQITGGNLTIINSTFGGNNAPAAYTDRTSTNVGNVEASSGGGVMFTPSAPMHTGGTGVLTVSGSTFSRNTAGSICCGGAGLDLVTLAFALPGGIGNGSATIGTTTISNNQSTAGNGGAIDVETLATTITGSTNFTNNSASNRGGAIYVGGASLHLDGSSGAITFTGNTSGTGIGTSLSTASTVNVSGTGTTIGGSISISTGGIFNMNAGSTLAPTDVFITGGTFNTNTSTVNIGGNLTIGPEAVVGGTFNGGNPGTINLAGNFVLNAGGSPATTLNAGTGTFNFNGGGAQSITNGTAITFNNLTDSNITQPLTLNNSLAVNGTLNVNGANATLSPVAGAVISGTGTLTGTGTARASRIAATADFLSQYTLTNKTLTNLTVDYNGGGNQTINNAPVYRHLRVSGGSGTKTLQGNTTITGNLTTVAGATFAGSTFNFSLGGNWTNGGAFTPGTGTVTFAGSSGTQLLTGDTSFFNLTLNNPGATTTFGTTTTTIQNDLVASAGTMEGGTSTLNFTGVTDNLGAISGAAAKNFHNLQVNSPATISHASGGNLTIENNYSGTGTFAQAPGLTTTFATDDNGSFSHSLSGGGPTTFGNVAIAGSNTLDTGTHNFNVVGASFDVAGTCTGGSTVNFNGALAQSISGNGNKLFNNLTANNASGVTVLDASGPVDAIVAGTLTLTTDVTVAPGAILQQSGTSAGAADVIGTVRRTDLGVSARSFGNPANTITIDGGSAPTQLDFALAKVAPAAFPVAVKVVPRAFTLTPTGGSGLSATLRLRYLDPAELAGPGITEARLGLWKRIGGTWVAQGGTVDAANNHVTLSGIASFSEWGIAETADLTLAKANNVGNAAVVGQPWTWTLTASNTGTPATFSAGQVILSDAMPNSNVVYGAAAVQNVSNVTGSANINCTVAAGDLVCTASGGPVTFDSNVGTSRFDVVVGATPQVAGVFQNPRAGGNAMVDPGSVVVESNEGNNAASTNSVTVARANTTTSLTADTPDPSISGEAVTVQWSVAVGAPGALGAPLSGNVTVGDGTDSCSAPVSAGQCTVTFATAGTRNLTATYAGDANYNGSASAAVPHSVNLAPPSIAKAFAPASITAGDASTVTLTLGNNNVIALTGAAFGDTLTNMSAAGGAVGGSCVGTTPGTLLAGTTALAFTGITIPAAGNCTVSFGVTSLTGGVHPNTTSGVTTTQTPAAGAASNTAELTVILSADLSVTKTDGVTSTTPGTPLSYTIVASNAGPSAAIDATVNDPFPSSLTGCGWTCLGAGGGTCTANGFGDIVDTVDLPLGASASYTANCTVSAAAIGAVSNTVTVAAPAGVTDPMPGNNSATDSDTLPPRPDLTLTKVHVGAFTRGDTGRTYTITVSNSGDGPSDGSTVTVTDAVPAGLTPTAASGTGWACGIVAQTMTCTRADVIGAGAATPAITLTVNVAGNAPSLVTNTATVSGGGNPASANDTASDPTSIGGDAIFANGFE